MQGDRWIIEIYDRETRQWNEEGIPVEDFGKLWRESEELARRGYKARIVKLSGPETPEQKQTAGETPEDAARRLGCTFSEPFNCEFCDKKSCPVSWYHIGTEEAAE
jgi:hypothetical protein